MALIPEKLIKSMADSFTHLRNIQELMEYGFVGMRTLKFFNGKLEGHKTKEHALVMHVTSKMLYVLQVSLDTLGGFI